MSSIRSFAQLALVASLVMVAATAAHAQPVAAPSAPVGNDPHAGMEGAPALERLPLTQAEPNKDVPPGSIRVRVLDSAEHPVPAAPVELGTMSQEAGREHVTLRTDQNGVCTFEKLAIGDKQAYRVNLKHQGAKYSATPFRLPPDQGYDVVIRRLDVTKDPKVLVLYVGATSVEIKDERLKIVQQARLFNVSSKTYVFPDEGLLVTLPKDVLAFQADEVMTDQRLVVEPGKGFRINGSIAPGEVTLTWGFDLPKEGDTADLSFEIPWPTFAYRVLCDAAPGLTFAVDDMPAAELHTDQGRRFFVSELVKRPGEAPLRSLRIHLRGIPGPGPLRFIATGLALLMLCIGVVIARKPPPLATRAKGSEDFETRKAALLERALALEAERKSGDVGEEFHASGMSAIEDELAALLYERERTRKLGLG